MRRSFETSHVDALCSARAQRFERAFRPFLRARPAVSAMTDVTPERLARENAYLKQRNVQLQDDVAALAAEGERLRQIVERLYGRANAHAPGPAGGGG